MTALAAETSDLSQAGMIHTSNLAMAASSAVTGEYKTWKQYDSRWGSKKFTGGQTMQQIGCLVTSIAICAVHAGVRTEAEFDPGKFLDQLNENKAFTSVGDLYWEKVSTAIPEFTVNVWNEKLSGKTQSQQIEAIKAHLDAGRQVVISVRNGNHWVAINAVNGNTVSIFDPGYNVSVLYDGTNGYRAEDMIQLAAFNVGNITQSADPTGITLSKTTASVTAGSSVTLTATVLPSNANNKTVTWSSSDAAVATVSSGGVVKGVKAGTAKITAKTANGKTATCTVTVTAKETLVQYTTTDELNYRSSPTTSGALKGTLAKGATVNVVDGYSQKADGYTWYKLKIGNDYYYAVSEYLKKKTTTVDATGITLSKTTASVTEGSSVTLTATVAPSNATNKTVTWSSSNTAVATVSSSGVVKGVKAGTAKITAKTNNGKTATCTVTVTAKETLVQYTTTDQLNYRASPGTDGALKGTLAKGATVNVVSGYSKSANGYTWYKIKIGSNYYYAASQYLKKKTTTVDATGVTLSKTTASVTEGSSVTLTATVAPSNATNKTVTWSSSNTAVATVSSSGVVKGVKAGTAKITAKTNNGKTATCTVTVTAKETLVQYTVIEDDVNYRTAPSLSGNIKSTLKRNATVNVVDGYSKTADGIKWYKIKIGSNYYYAASQYLKKKVTTVAVTGVKLNKTTASVTAGSSVTLTATVSPTNATTKTVTWSSSSTAVATVTSSGVVKGVKAGTAKITAKSNNGKTATCTVTVTAKETLVQYTVTDDDVNYRTAPSLSGSIKSTLKKNAKVNVVDGYSKTADGIKWYKIKISSQYYYVSSAYLKKVSTAATETLVKYVTTDSLNYRTSPGTSAGLGGTLSKGAAVNVVSGYSKSANGYTWYKIKIGSKYYYVASSYLKKG